MDLACVEEPNQNMSAIMENLRKLKGPVRAPASLPPQKAVPGKRFTFQTEGARARLIGKGTQTELKRFGVDSFVEYESAFVKSWWLVVDTGAPVYVIKMNAKSLLIDGTPSIIFRCKDQPEPAYDDEH